MTFLIFHHFPVGSPRCAFLLSPPVVYPVVVQGQRLELLAWTRTACVKERLLTGRPGPEALPVCLPVISFLLSWEFLGAHPHRGC